MSDRILMVDDDADNLALLAVMLEDAGYRDVIATTDPLRAVDLFRSKHPDLLLVDLHMPGLDGCELTRRVRGELGARTPVIVLTADHSPTAKKAALEAGASDFLTKPFDPSEVTLRIHNLIEVARLNSELTRRNVALDDQVKRRTRALEQARVEVLDRLAIAAEYRDDETGQHAQRVGRLAELVARQCGLAGRHIERLRRAAPLHDLGKIGIPDRILLKPGPLTRAEFETVKTHTSIGARILAHSRVGLLRMAEQIARTHHERWDGAGYHGLKGDETPVVGRIVAVVDAFDAMTSDRPYRPARSKDEALNELMDGRGSQFDPVLVDAFLAFHSTSRQADE